MLVIKIELWPGGRESAAKEIGREYIANVGGDHEHGDYVAAVCRRGSSEMPREILAGAFEDLGRDPTIEPQASKLEALSKGTRAGRIFGYPREAYNVWRLVLRSLRVMFPEESPKSTRLLQERIDAAIKIGRHGGSMADVLEALDVPSKEPEA